MGDDLNIAGITKPQDSCVLPPWVDQLSRRLVVDLILALANHYQDLLAVVLYGSMARHTERPLADPNPSDIDLLAIFASEDRHLAAHRGGTVSALITAVWTRQQDAPREVQVMLASQTLVEWDPAFVESIEREGIVLWTRDIDFALSPLHNHTMSTG